MLDLVKPKTKQSPGENDQRLPGVVLLFVFPRGFCIPAFQGKLWEY